MQVVRVISFLHPAAASFGGNRAGSKLVLALGVEELPGAVVIGHRHEDLGRAAQITVVRRGGIHEGLRGGDAMLFKHHYEHLGIDDRAGVKQFHAANLTADEPARYAEMKSGTPPAVFSTGFKNCFCLLITAISER